MFQKKFKNKPAYNAKRSFAGRYRIESCRLKGWDYSSAGYYFVTICSKDRICYFGEIKNYKMYLSEIGKIVENEWLQTTKIRKNVKLDEFIIMPNHIHGILIISNTCRDEASPRLYDGEYFQMSKISPKPNSLSSIIGSFKSVCTKKIRRINDGFVWQERFYDHIIRNEKSLEKIRRYIIENPERWEKDRNNPTNLYM